MRGWEMVISKYHEGDVVKGKVTRKIKGGLLVDIGVQRLPARQPGGHPPARRHRRVHRPRDRVQDPQDRREPAQHRRLPPQAHRGAPREQQKKQLLAEIEVGQVRKGMVKNIADFGAFVDLGGIDGLLHITDMSWGRINHPCDMVKIDEEIEVMVLHVDKERRRSPWASSRRPPARGRTSPTSTRSAPASRARSSTS